MSSLKISGKTTVYGIIGDPVDHSMSPIIQNIALREMCLDAIYVPFHVKKSDLKQAVEGLVAIGVRGFNVTAPHKVKIIRYLTKLDRNAADIQSVNTVINHNGSLEGFNTDGIGALRAIKIESLRNASVLLFGAGGAARAIAHAYAPEVRSIRIANRTMSKGKMLERAIRKKFRRKVHVEAISLVNQRLPEFIRSADVIVNASSMGMNDKKLPVKAAWFHPSQVVFDIVYNPVETELLRLAKSAGARTVNGLEMLLNQGCCSFNLWTGLNPPITAMRQVLIDQLGGIHA